MSAKKQKSTVPTVKNNSKTSVSQRTGEPSTISSKTQVLIAQAVRIARYLAVSIKQFFQVGVAWLRSVPSQTKAIPKKIVSWHRNDKKKKKYRSFRLQKRIKAESRYIPSSRDLFSQSLALVIRNLPLFLAILLLHGMLYAILVKTSATVDVSTVQRSVKEIFGNKVGTVSGTAALVGTVLGSPRKVETGSFAITSLVITTSLIYVWAIRERINGVSIRARDAIFNGLSPLVSTLVILLFMGVQLIPFGIATFFYTSARSNSLFASGFEDIFFFMITFFSGLVSFYFLTSSIIALYAAALPGVYPLSALKAAKELVAFRRLSIFRRVLSLAVLISLTYLVLLVVVVRLFPDKTYTFIDIYQIAIIPFTNVYLYKLYRALL